MKTKMPNYFARVFTALNTPYTSPFQKHLPMINSLTNSLYSYLSEYGQVRKKKELMAWYKRIPELTGLTNKVAKDIVGKYHFEAVGKDASTGRNRLLKANRFAAEVALRKTMLSHVVDMLVTGDGFGWIGKMSKSNLKELVDARLSEVRKIGKLEKKSLSSAIMDSLMPMLECKIENNIEDLTSIDEDLLRPRKYRSIASSTMEIVFDQYDIQKYIQWVGGNQQEFSTEEIIHFTLQDVDGKINGFTPVECVIVQLELLRLMWQNMLSIHKNGGAPDKLFVLEDIKPGTEAYSRIEQQLQKYKLVENKHGNMLFTGKVTVEELNQLDKMQFMDSGLYITGVMAMQWQIPRSSIPYVVGQANTKDDTGGNSERGYWMNIDFAQQIFAETFNTQFWMPYFGVKLVFDNAYVQHDVQIETANSLKFNNVKLVDDMAKSHGKQLTFEKLTELIGLHPDYFEEAEQMMPVASTMNQQLSKDEVGKSDDKKNADNRKKVEQQNVIASRGISPSGVGKEKYAKYPYIF